MKRRTTTALGGMIGACLVLAPAGAQAADTLLFDGANVANVIYDSKGAGRTTRLAAELLAKDLTTLSGQASAASGRAADCRNICVVIGLHMAPLVQKLARSADEDLSGLAGQWEVYRRFVVRNEGKTYVVIAGSDRRGAVYGAVDLSRQLGVSPWEWWADVTPARQDRLVLSDAPLTSKAPSVQYRGIFLNDEDWGLVPWAAKTYDPKTGNIGPKTYAKVYELMWRLKANTVWPAMHTISTPFYGIKENPVVADDYAVVVGTSHAEPMMRNNLREWDEHSRGAFDFTKNRTAILDYWRQRVGQGKAFENIYTVGLRGIHDGPMQGASTMAERQAILQNVIGLQREILGTTYMRPVENIPQVYVAYHELQEAYDAGLRIPEDVTLMWADDNYGYIRRFSTPDEMKRPGGSGVYYHLSYWGRPHDYLWLGTTHPYLIHEQMGRAWDLNARRMWIANVGDIKPIEYLTQYFLDLAFDADRFREDPKAHLAAFMADVFGPSHAGDIADIMMDYYDLAFERKPEFMGFGQTEWVTQNRHSDFVRGDGEEAQTRIAAYERLTARAEALAAQMPEARKDAFFELVLYPVRASSALNQRILKLDLADLYAGQDRASANLYVDEAKSAHQTLVEDTATYNALAGGKWREMMDMAPRRLPVFDQPVWPQWSQSAKDGCELAVSGQWFNDNNTLPFVAGQAQSRPVTLYTHRPQPLAWETRQNVPGFTLSETSGRLDTANRYEARLTLNYDGTAKAGDYAVPVQCGDTVLPIYVRVLPALPAGMPTENNRVVTIPATTGTTGKDWQTIAGLGSMGAALRARLDLPSTQANAGALPDPAVYDFVTSTDVGAVMRIIALPTHALSPDKSVRIAVQLDDMPLQIVDLATLGRSDVWRNNVLTNTAVATIPLKHLSSGRHQLKVYPLDPGVMLDRIEINLDRAPAHYGPYVLQTPSQ